VRHIRTDIMRYNRQPVLSDWFSKKLDDAISESYYTADIEFISDKLINELKQYREKHNIKNVIIGMSGGIDSATTAALFKHADYKVYGYTLPIHQKTEETERGAEACLALGINHANIDLSDTYDMLYHNMARFDSGLLDDKNIDVAKRRGNIRARLRMMTLYNKASKHRGFVASTDNFSELAAGFWTLHGDVGDVAPIQSLNKSWEVPALAEFLNIPKATIEAVPTDGLGISNSDEDQFGFSYLEFDLALRELMYSAETGEGLEVLDERDAAIVIDVFKRTHSTSHKRANPLNLNHPIHIDKYSKLENLDRLGDLKWKS